MFRGRSGVKDLDELIPDRDKRRYAHFNLSDGSVALVYWSRSAAQPPSWANFLNGIVDSKELRTQSSSAVIALQRRKTWYLVTFGYGRYLLNADLVEPSFGLKCTLNGVDPEKIRSIDRKRVDTVARLTREQLSRDSRMGAFGVDIFQDLLSAVTGVPTMDGLGTRMFGKDAVGLNIEIKPEALGELADLLEDVYGRTTYQAQFRWVDRIGEVSGAKEVETLNKELLRVLRKGGSGLDLAPPEIVDWSKAHGYVYRTGEDPEPELTLESYHDRVRSPNSLTIDVLKNDRVQLRDGDGNKLGGWSVYRCITGEMTHKGGVYVISDGKWYRIDSDFLTEVDAAVTALQASVVTLPAYKHKSEGEYNKDVAANSGGTLVCMDQEFISPRSWHDRLEFCDLYSADRKIVHVKRYSGSATLSHLFAQGAVSLRCLLGDLQFLSELDAKLPPTHGFAGTPPTPATCHVVYAIVAEQKKALKLPFFSRVSLRNAAEMIHNLGVSVSYQEIPNHST